MDTDAELDEQIRKWTERLGNALTDARAMSQKGVEYMTNIQAYQEDSIHFYQEGDKVRAFEALLWAWAYLTIAKDLELVEADLG